MSKTVYTMPAGVDFLGELAEELQRKFGDQLQDALILLPTRRAVRELGDILVGSTGAKILPRMRPLADIDPDEPPFEPGYLSGLVKPAIASTKRRFELARLVGQYHSSSGDPLGPSDMLALAEPLIAILDDAAMEEVGLEKLSELEEIREFAALHFQNAAKFYEILQLHWPRHLEKLDVMEPMARRVALLNELASLWEDRPPRHPVIIAGSTGTLPATARLMNCVRNMNDGLIILPGLDKNMPEEAWNEVRLKDEMIADKIVSATPEHPQYSLKKLLDKFNLERNDIDTIGSEKHGENPRLALISEALVPADSTSGWPDRINNLTDGAKNKNFFPEALDGLSIIEARTDDEEALSIALIMREAVDTGNETAALITPDPSLARRVKARLRRWNIYVDYSQGEPLEETSLGSFFSLILRLANEPDDPVHMAALFKHPLAQFGLAPGAAQMYWEDLERVQFRGDVKKRKKAASEEALQSYLLHLSRLESDLIATADDWAQRITSAAETIADTDEIAGAERLWNEDAGEKAASLIKDLIAHGAILGDMSLSEFTRLFGTLMRGKVVRPRYGTHPRLQIFGPLEARMLNADTIILGGLNEGVWPSRPAHRPFLSRGMRQKLGLSLPERRLGLSAHDFQQLAANKRVFLTRAKRSEDGPRVASRWLWRLQILVKGALGDGANEALSSEHPYLKWARSLDEAAPDQVKAARRPDPRPPLEKRWPKGRQLSVTRVKTWVRDPYAIYARTILDLKPLEDLSALVGPREYGNALHKGIERFTKANKNDLTAKAEMQLAEELEKALLDHGFADYHLVKERPRLARISADFVAWARKRAETNGGKIWPEIITSWRINDVNFTLTGQPDRIEVFESGYSVIDYKTGAPPTVKVVQAGFDPQLPLLGAMIEAGAFEQIGRGEVHDLIYIRIKGSGRQNKFENSIVDVKNGVPAEDLIGDALGDLKDLIQEFDKVDTAYHSQPRAKYKDDYGDYDHLARRGEWAKLGNEEEGGNG
ncbi:MAG: double-strand break repair protein AddB [Hellea sp.]|nr:double-strand break repair protein AddB [Hellea sp.]